MTNNQLCNLIGGAGCAVCFFGMGLMFFGIPLAALGVLGGMILAVIALLNYD